MKKTDSYFLFTLVGHVKQNRPGNTMSSFYAQKFPKEELCVYRVLKAYLERKVDLRKETKLLVSFAKPHNPIGVSTIGRWIKTVLTLSGIDTKIFSAHSTRSAAVSKADKSIPTDTILKHVGWSSSSVFSRFYKKPISDAVSFDKAVLQ